MEGKKWIIDSVGSGLFLWIKSGSGLTPGGSSTLHATHTRGAGLLTKHKEETLKHGTKNQEFISINLLMQIYFLVNCLDFLKENDKSNEC